MLFLLWLLINLITRKTLNDTYIEAIMYEGLLIPLYLLSWSVKFHLGVVLCNTIKQRSTLQADGQQRQIRQKNQVFLRRRGYFWFYNLLWVLRYRTEGQNVLTSTQFTCPPDSISDKSQSVLPFIFIFPNIKFWCSFTVSYSRTDVLNLTFILQTLYEFTIIF